MRRRRRIDRTPPSPFRWNGVASLRVGWSPSQPWRRQRRKTSMNEDTDERRRRKGVPIRFARLVTSLPSSP